jgi:glutamate synthase (NADPH/NADH) large chain
MFLENDNQMNSDNLLVDPGEQRSNCGVGVLMDFDGVRTHELVDDAMTLLENLDHRGARGAEPNTGDGAGILLQKPHSFFEEVTAGVPAADEYGVGQVFLPQDAGAQEQIRDLMDEIVSEEGFEIFNWRDVPTDNSDLGRTAVESEPDIWQFFVRPEESLDPEQIDAGLYILRCVLEKRIEERELDGADRFYICSLDRRKLVYKGLLTNPQLRTYFPDLSHEALESSLAFVHSRFSTNTLGAWELAHPYRNIVHNGEINTLRGNVNWMKTREAEIEHEKFGSDIDKLKPVTKEDQSDTAIIDNVLELLVESGRDLPHVLRMLVPEAWNKDEGMDPERREWYDYHSSIVEPWDGPLLVAFTDGKDVGAILDRNGLRPCRYYVTQDDRLIMASEAGALDVDSSQVKKKGRLQPGQMFMASSEEGRIISDDEVFEQLTDEKYGEWLEENRVKLDEVRDNGSPADLRDHREDVTAQQQAQGYTLEHLRRLIKPMSEEGKDPIGAMGDDTPLSVLSDRNKTLFTYFKQLFAQVSNPPIDYIREEVVTSLESHIGRQNNLLKETPEHCRQLSLESPILTNGQMRNIQELDENGIEATTIDITFSKSKSLEAAIEDLQHDAVRAIIEGHEIIVLSDRRTNEDRIPIPSLLATGAVHHHLIREGLRTRVGLVVESGQPCAVHHFSTLIGYGAGAVNPYLAFRSIEDLLDRDKIEEVDELETAIDTYIHGVEHGLKKVMSKMGISTLESYKGAQIFEAVGLDSEFVEEFFYGTTARTEGIGLEELEEDVRERHDEAFDEPVEGNLNLDQGGEYYWRRDGEFHQWNPQTIGKLQQAVRSGDKSRYDEFADHINQQEQKLQTLRGLLEFDTDRRESIPLEDVEPIEEIRTRFFTGSMSFGSLSKEAHETLAVAMNEIGGTACTGEGGEQSDRFGTDRECSNKQVASGRFGVTSDYLVNAEELEIKMAQGSKPGEGGHLPGEKVNEIIAETRSTTPGISLISPPPHHDIYSIEDLAQLIHDLKCSNPDGDVSVKLVSEAGVGIIAAGVAKAKADVVLISGASGGTGASPKTSIKNAGLPWELGVAEANQILRANNLRSRIRVKVDGGLKTGRDAVVAALLGAEEFGYGTGPLIAVGCVMLRKCHCNTCSVGVATQDPELRDRFPGKPEHVVNYMNFMAQEIREYMAELGFETVDEMIGRVDFLNQRDVDHPRAGNLDLSRILSQVDTDDDPRKTMSQNHGLDEKLDNMLIEMASPALENQEQVNESLKITNRDRTVGTMLSSRVAEEYGSEGLPDNTITFHFDGSAGQSFGAFLSPGMTFDLSGDANDYVGKGLSGGKLIIRTPEDAPYEEDENILIGNVALYGATRGELYVNGVAGERFAVRNSGVKAVAEGVGDHGCEYMTGGVAVILGETGKNFGAGMSGGEAYVLDEDGDFPDRVNRDMVDVRDMTEERDRDLVHRMIRNHYQYTNSEKAGEILDNWPEYRDQFVKVMPEAYEEIIADYASRGQDIRIEPPPPADDAEELLAG